MTCMPQHLGNHWNICANIYFFKLKLALLGAGKHWWSKIGKTMKQQFRNYLLSSLTSHSQLHYSHLCISPFHFRKRSQLKASTCVIFFLLAFLELHRDIYSGHVPNSDFSLSLHMVLSCVGLLPRFFLVGGRWARLFPWSCKLVLIHSELPRGFRTKKKLALYAKVFKMWVHIIDC